MVFGHKIVMVERLHFTEIFHRHSSLEQNSDVDYLIKEKSGVY